MSDSSKPFKGAEHKHGFLWWLAAFLVVFILLLIAFVLVIWASPMGRTYLANQAIGFAPLPEGMTLQSQQLDSPSLGRWSLGSLVVAQDKKPLLEIEDFDVHFRASDLLNGSIHVPLIGAKVIRFWPDHLPATNTPSQPPLSLEEQIDQLAQLIEIIKHQLGASPFSMQLDALNLEQVSIMGKTPVDFSLQAKASLAQLQTLA